MRYVERTSLRPVRMNTFVMSVIKSSVWAVVMVNFIMSVWSVSNWVCASKASRWL